MTKEQFFASLVTIEEFEFGPDGQRAGTPSGDRDWVTAAQEAAAAALDDARDLYHKGDFAGALSAFQDGIAWRGEARRRRQHRRQGAVYGGSL